MKISTLKKHIAKAKKDREVSLDSIEHPYRYLASCIIDEVIEPQFNRGHCIKGEKYYNLEDELTLLINRVLTNKK